MREKETLESMDIRHFYLEKGEGEPLLLLHGNGESSAYFEHQLEAFAQRYHVFALDTRGHGKTPRGEQPFTIRQFAEDLYGFMEEHHLDRAHLLGFSDGGNIAMVFALRYPERVHRLILNGANFQADGVKRRVQLPIELGYRIAGHFAGKSEGAKRKAELLGLMVNDPNLTPEELSGIRAKTLVLAGTKDLIRESHTRQLAASIPGAKLSFLPGDHFVAHQNPKAFNAVVLDFLKG